MTVKLTAYWNLFKIVNNAVRNKWLLAFIPVAADAEVKSSVQLYPARNRTSLKSIFGCLMRGGNWIIYIYIKKQQLLNTGLKPTTLTGKKSLLFDHTTLFIHPKLRKTSFLVHESDLILFQRLGESSLFFFQSRVITLYPHSGIHLSNIQAHPLGNRELYDDFNC